MYVGLSSFIHFLNQHPSGSCLPGAYAALLSRRRRREAASCASSTVSIDLLVDPAFVTGLLGGPPAAVKASADGMRVYIDAWSTIAGPVTIVPVSAVEIPIFLRIIILLDSKWTCRKKR